MGPSIEEIIFFTFLLMFSFIGELVLLHAELRLTSHLDLRDPYAGVNEKGLAIRARVRYAGNQTIKF